MKTQTKKLFVLPALFVGLGLMLAGRVTAQTFTNLHSFTDGIDGVSLQAGLVLSGNVLYGTTEYGGPSGNNSTLFAVNTNGSGFRIVYNFPAEANNNLGFPTNSGAGGSDGTLVLSGNTFYGASYDGGTNGTGAVFAVNTNGTFTLLHSLNAAKTNPVTGLFTNSDGYGAEAGMILSGSTLYGTTEHGGTSGYGVVFKVNTNGTGFVNLHNFTNGTDGSIPHTLVISGSTLYGTSLGFSGNGTVFALNTNGTGFTTLHTFTATNFSFPQGGPGPAPGYTNSDGVGPAGLILAGNILYGTAFSGGTNGNGTVFALNTNGTGFTTLHSFAASRTNSSGVYTNSEGFGAIAFNGLVLSSNILYGTAYYGGSAGNGTVFALNTNGTGFTTLYIFSPTNGSGYNLDGANPYSGLTLSGNNLYGTTKYGGTSGGGTVFSIYLGLVATTTSLPTGTNGVSYSQTLLATGGQKPYSWTNISGTLPPGLTLATNGVISGTPANNGTYNFIVKVTDALSATATQLLSLQVANLAIQFSATPTNGLVPLTVQFNTTNIDSLGNAINSWQWDFGDGVTSLEQNPLHTYSNAGTFAPSLSAVDSMNVAIIGYGKAITAAFTSVTNFVFITNNSAITITAYTGNDIEVSIPPTINGFPVASIGDGAFYNHNGLISVTIPNSITSIGDSNDNSGVFGGCTSLTYFTVPNSVTSVGRLAFNSCYGLTNITIGSGVTNIGNGAFTYCTSLTSITIPNNVTSIGAINDPWGVFSHCTSLTNVTIGNSLTIIGAAAFYNCTSLTTCAMPNGIKIISMGAFLGCGNLANIIIPNSVTTIGDGAFSYSGLTSITIPDSVTILGDNNDQYGVFGGCTSLTNAFIGSGITFIDPYAFAYDAKLVSVTIGSHVTAIGDAAFYEDLNLKALYFLGNAPSFVNGAFYPDTATVYYLPGTTGWSQFLSSAGLNGGLWIIPGPFQYTVSPTYGPNPLLVQFASPGTDSGGNTITNWNWNFGDGTTSTGPSPTHVYTSTGTFQPILIATNSQGTAISASGPAIQVVNCAVSAPQGLVSWWSGNGNAVDSISGNNGLVQSGVIYTNGMVGQAFGFDGSSGYLNTSQVVTNPQNFSLAMWFKTTTTQGGLLLGFDSSPNGNSSTYDRHLYMDNSGLLHFGTYNSGFQVVSTSTSYNDGNWHHVVAVLSTQSGSSLFVDGQLQTYGPTYTTAVNYNGYWRIGENTLTSWPSAPNSHYFAGALDELMLFNRPLTSSEIQAIYQAGTNGMCPPTPLMFTGAPSFSKASGVVLNASLRSGQSYHLQSNTNLASTNWITLTNFVAGTAPISHLTNQPPANAPQGFYRIVSP